MLIECGPIDLNTRSPSTSNSNWAAAPASFTTTTATAPSGLSNAAPWKNGHPAVTHLPSVIIEPCAIVKDGAVPQSPNARGAPSTRKSEAYVRHVFESVSRNLPPSNANLPVAAPACSRPHWQLTKLRVLRLGSFDSPTQYCFHLFCPFGCGRPSPETFHWSSASSAEV